jgi:hypothetical protein
MIIRNRIRFLLYRVHRSFEVTVSSSAYIAFLKENYAYNHHTSRMFIWVTLLTNFHENLYERCATVTHSSAVFFNFLK